MRDRNFFRKTEIEKEMNQKLFPSLPLLLAARERNMSRLGDAHRSLGLLGPHIQVTSMALLRAQQRVCSRNLGT